MEINREQIIELIKNKLQKQGKTIDEIDNESFEKLYNEVKNEIIEKNQVQQVINNKQEQKMNLQSYNNVQQIFREKHSVKPNLKNISEENKGRKI